MVENVICVLDREQGGAEALKKAGIHLHSVLKVSRILEYLQDAGQIDNKQLVEIRDALANPKMANQKDSTLNVNWSLSARANALSENQLNARLLKIMLEKKSNLCVAVDVPNAAKVLEVNC